MPSSGLRLTLMRDHDGSGLLTTSVVAGAFSGTSDWWIELDELAHFADALRHYPIRADRHPLLQGGHWRDGELVDCFLRIAVKPHNAVGLLRTEVELAPRIDESTELPQRVSAQFLVEYAVVERFAEALDRLLAGEVDGAVLLGRS
jgi:hypothetical protein